MIKLIREYKKQYKQGKQKGSALVTILIFVAMGITVTSAAVAVVIINTQGLTRMINGEKVYLIAEAGAENAMVQLLRDPAYSGETLTIDGENVTISVSGDTTKTVTAQGTLGDFIRKIQVTADVDNNTISVTDWSEIN